MRRWKPFLITLAVFAAVVGATTLYIRSAADRRWEGMRSQALQFMREDHARPSERPVLRGTAEPGNAWDDYAQALLVMETRPGDRSIPPEGHRLPSRQVLEPIVSAHRGALLALGNGARKGRCWVRRREPDGSRGDWGDYRYRYVVDLTRLVLVQARFLAEDGEGRAAADLLLDLGQFGRDLGASIVENGGSGWGGPLKVCLGELRKLVLSNRLTEKDLKELARQLEILVGSLWKGAPLEKADLVEFAFGSLEAYNLYTSIRSGFCEREVVPWWGAWRYGFSDRLMTAAAFDELVRQYRKLGGLADARWPQVRRALDQAAQETLADSNPMVREHVWMSIYSGPAVRGYHAELRLLRLAAHYRATGEFIEIDDPFGTNLRWQEDGCRFRLWSVGADKPIELIIER